ncbi:PREDICTED: uncharacterized protein LOC109387697 [Hipposideros armiger]|uniref:Uncharacterized protein LOC109387697 n=1 Tax=Hipposideros armiger TaxID=186990 RepID=A0A8B7S1W1_HIPAR|nr:PREDICTED: uncharacterized protein LOC109387697 [Hipposideros armiger]
MLPSALCACGSGLTLPCAELSPGFPRESSSGSSAGKEREWWKGKLGFPLSLPTLAAAFSPLGGICSWQQQRRRQPRHPSHAPRRQGPRGWPGGRRDRGEPADGVPGPQSCAGNLPWKSLLLHPGHFKRRWRQTARGCRPDNKPPLFRRCSDLWRWQVSKKCPAGPSLQRYKPGYSLAESKRTDNKATNVHAFNFSQRFGIRRQVIISKFSSLLMEAISWKSFNSTTLI